MITICYIFLYKVIYIVEVIYLYFQFNSKPSLYRFFTLLPFFLLLKLLNIVPKSRTLSKCSSFIRLKINKSTCPRINLVDLVSNQTILYFLKTNAYLPNSTVNKLARPMGHVLLSKSFEIFRISLFIIHYLFPLTLLHEVKKW